MMASPAEVDQAMKDPLAHAADLHKYQEMLIRLELINSLVQKLAQKSRRKEEQTMLYSALSAEIDNSGQTLFEFHLCSRLAPQIEADQVLKAGLATLWSRLSDEEKRYWEERTAIVSKSLRYKLPSVLVNFEPLKDTEHRKYCHHIQQALLSTEEPELDINQLLHKFQALDLEAQCTSTSQLRPHIPPITRHIVSETLFGGPLPPAENITSAIRPILTSIQTRYAASPLRPHLTLRIGDVRITFGPHDSSITGIAARLETATKRGLDPQIKYDAEDPRSHFEWLLRPLAVHRCELFSDIEALRKGGEHVAPAEHRASYILEDKYPATKFLGLPEISTFGPMSPEKKEEVIGAIRAKLNVRKKAKDIWAAKLHICFERPGLSSEEYGDLVEQQLHYLLRKYGRELRR